MGKRWNFRASVCFRHFCSPQVGFASVSSPAPRFAMVSTMHEFLGKKVTNWSRARARRLGVTSSEHRRGVTCGLVRKSLGVVSLSVYKLECRHMRPVTSRELSTRAAAFSTRALPSTQLRDLDFVTRASTTLYLTTGVETRMSSHSRPARPAVETAFQARIEDPIQLQYRRYINRAFVSRLS